MDFYDLITHRRSIRDYNPDTPVPEDVLHRILEAGRVAPSAANRQPWRFIVVQSEVKLQEVKATYPRSWFQDTPCILAVVGNPNEAWTRSYDGYNSIETDLTIAMDHMILAAAYESIGTCWIIAFDEPMLRKALELADEEVIYAITPLGYSHKGYLPKSGPDRKLLSDIVHII